MTQAFIERSTVVSKVHHLSAGMHAGIGAPAHCSETGELATLDKAFSRVFLHRRQHAVNWRCQPL
jgi:hypothetical protein